MLDRIQSLAGNVKRERPRAADPGAGAGGHRCSGISPAAAADASKACCWPVGSLVQMSSIRTRLRAVASSTTCRPAAVTETITDRRSAPGAMPAVQLLADQPIGHPPSCRRGYIKRGGEVRHPLRSPGGQHDQHPVLSGRGVLGGRPQRRRADRNQRPARGQHGVHNGRFHQRLRLLCSSQYSHHATSRYYFNSPMHTNSESDVLPERPGIWRRPGQRDAVALLLAGADARCASGQALRSAAMAPGMLAQADHLTSGMMTRPKSCSSTKAPAVRQGGQGRL